MYTPELIQIIKEITTTSNPRTWNTSKRGNQLIKIYKNEIINSTSFLSNNIQFSERFYCILNNINKRTICKYCKNPTKYTNSLNGYQPYCSKKCCNNDPARIKKMINTTYKKYGLYSTNQLESVKKKKEQTCLKHFGVKHSTQSEQMKQKSKNTLLKKYGVDNPTKSDLFVKKSIATRLKTQGDIFLPNIGINEENILNNLEKIDKCKIDRKFKCLPYYPDGYCHESNTVYEVYEKQHRTPKKKEYDIKRQRYIQETLKCTFIIIWDLKNSKKTIIERHQYNQQDQ